MKPFSIPQVAALLVATAVAWILPQAAQAIPTWMFYGEAIHVSATNLKVIDPKTRQTMTFLMDPNFGNIFTSDGKTKAMRKVAAGQYVGVLYDRRAMGATHVDKIYIMNNANQRIGAP
jgi:hypothetical protein